MATLARLGRVEAHGIALAPGTTAAFGMVGVRPVLLLPGRLDGALAVWLLLGEPLLARLAARRDRRPRVTARLARKVASNLGLAELVPVRLRDGKPSPGLGLPAAADDRSGRRLDPGRARQRRLPGRRRSHGKTLAMIDRSAVLTQASDLLAAIRQAARQEQFLEVVSAEEAARALRAISSWRRCRPRRSRSRRRLAGCWPAM